MKTVALIPAAGSSSRFRELGKHYAKTVLPFRGRPIIAHIVERIIEAKSDIDKIFVIVNNSTHREQIEEALGTCDFGSIGLCVVHEFNEEEIDIKRGPAKTIVAGLELIRSRYQEDVEVLVHLSDSLFKTTDISSMFVEKSATIGTQLVDDQKRWCVIDKDNRFHNKPTENIQGAEALSGLYKFRLSSIDTSRAVFSDKESQISDLLLTINDHIEPICAPIELDFGTLEEYIANRGIKTTRSFNTVFEHGDCVVKTTICGSDVEFDSKLRREINWYSHAPSGLKPYLPSIYSHSDLSDTRERASFKMEKIKGVNLRDLALYLDRTEETWEEIFTAYREKIYSKSIRRSQSFRSNVFWLDMFEKTQKRVKETNISCGNTVGEFTERFREFCYARDSSNNTDWIHGDLHFANMFYDLHYRELKLIDPRGDLCGDLFYDLAKLNHSVNGNYDCIDSQLYYFDQNGEVKYFMNERRGIVDAYEKMLVDIGLSEQDRRDLNLVTASLFLSMIPLHFHNNTNQRLFYSEFERFFSLYTS